MHTAVPHSHTRALLIAPRLLHCHTRFLLCGPMCAVRFCAFCALRGFSTCVKTMSTQPDASAPPGENWAEPEAQAHAHGSTSVSTIQGNSLPEPHDVVETHKQHNQGQAGVAPHQSHPAYEHGRDENVAPQATPPPPLGPAYYSYGGTPWFPHGEEMTFFCCDYRRSPPTPISASDRDRQ